MNGAPKGILMIAFHYPPCAGSSGLLRSFCFANDLLSHGWSPIVLSASPRAYAQTSDDLLQRIASGVRVYRAAAWDTAENAA